MAAGNVENPLCEQYCRLSRRDNQKCEYGPYIAPIAHIGPLVLASEPLCTRDMSPYDLTKATDKGYVPLIRAR